MAIHLIKNIPYAQKPTAFIIILIIRLIIITATTLENHKITNQIIRFNQTLSFSILFGIHGVNGNDHLLRLCHEKHNNPTQYK